MHARASITSMYEPDRGMTLLLFSSNEERARKLSARLHAFAKVHWENSEQFSVERWAQLGDGQHLVLLDYASDNTALSTAIARQLATLAPDQPLLGIGSAAADRGHGVLAALRVGVLDFIDTDAGNDDIRALLDRVLRSSSTARPAASATVPNKRGQLVLLLGVRPGVGTSTLTAHLGAMAMSAATAKNPVPETAAPQALVLDLGQPSGDAGLYLGVEGDFHYGDALHSAGRIDATLIRTALPRHASGLAVLGQPRDAASAPAEVLATNALVERLLGIVDLLLCDLGGLPMRQIPPALLREADAIWLIADQGIGSVVSLNTCLDQLEQAQTRDQRLALVIDRHDEDCGLGAQQIAKRFSLPLLATLPERGRTLRASANRGLLLHQSAPRDPYVRALAPLLAQLHIGATRASPRPLWKKLVSSMRGA